MPITTAGMHSSAPQMSTKVKQRWAQLVPPGNLLLDSVPNLGPLISRWEINKFENCWYKSVRILEVLKLSFQQFLNLSSSQRDMSGPILGTLSNNRWLWGTWMGDSVRILGATIFWPKSNVNNFVFVITASHQRGSNFSTLLYIYFVCFFSFFLDWQLWQGLEVYVLSKGSLEREFQNRKKKNCERETKQ
jgi:hypothetical protein